jgi:transcriptional regulator with GAF, ATPase, and Fis domain
MSSAQVSGLRWDPDAHASPALSAVNRTAPADPDVIVGESDTLRYVMSRIEKVAGTDATVLLTGETGTGKELLARAIHRQSPRRDRAFVIVNCAAVPAGLLESELFGRERGAFTGAHVSQPGRFELANRGTLFLDEIGELPLELQPKLLRALQKGGIERLGSTRTIDLDVRIIAATNSDLGEEVRERRFRIDLFYRLNVFPITVPSLRDRREDIPLLVRHMLERYSRVLRKTVEVVPPAVMQVLESYDWPGNIRELENVIQRAIILSNSRTLELHEAWLPGATPPPAAPATSLSEVERRHMVSVLEQCRWKIEGPSGAARLLGLRPSTLRTRLRKRGIVRPG